jgi:hypothetical protein
MIHVSAVHAKNDDWSEVALAQIVSRFSTLRRILIATFYKYAIDE